LCADFRLSNSMKFDHPDNSVAVAETGPPAVVASDQKQAAARSIHLDDTPPSLPI